MKKTKKNSFIFAITTYNRISSLKKTINTWNKTRNKSYNWTLIIADDGSTDGTLEYLEKLNISDVHIKIIKNNRSGVHHQTNQIFKESLNLNFDYGFKSDDDVVFLKKGWDDMYYDVSKKSKYFHLIYCNKDWSKRKKHLRKSIIKNGILENCTNNLTLQGALFTFNKKVLEDVGFFDTIDFGKSGVGHIDFSLRCCRLGYNELSNPFDIKNSNEFISLNTVESSRCKIKDNQKYKYKIAISERTFIPYKK